MGTYPRELGKATQSVLARPARTMPNRFRVLGVRVDAVQTHDTVARMEAWITALAACHFIAVHAWPRGMTAQWFV